MGAFFYCKHSLTWRWAVFATCLFFFCVRFAAAEPEPEPSFSHVKASIERLAREHHVCALSYAMIESGRLSHAGGLGGCNGDTAIREPSEDSVFQAASLSKPVFAYAVLKLAQEGLLDLDAPLLSYLPQGYSHIRNPFAFDKAPITDLVVTPELGAVTARMVLHHTSGLPNWTSDPLNFDFPPGSAWEYSGEGFMLLQRAIESITGEGLEDFMQRRIFQPLGMSNTAFVWKPQFADAFIPGRPQYVEITRAFAPFSLHTSAKDYAKFLAALMADRQAMYEIMRSPVSVDPDLNLAWGLGWGIEQGEQEAFLWQWGNNPGYRAFVMASARTGKALVLFTNSDDGLAMAEPVVTVVFPGKHKLFRSYLVREGILYFACRNFDWCM